VWREPIELLEKVKGKRNPSAFGPRLMAPSRSVGAPEFEPSLGGIAEDGSGTGTMEGDDDLEVDLVDNLTRSGSFSFLSELFDTQSLFELHS
jgi:hypothetical protein